MGRPSKFSELLAEKIINLYSSGSIDREVAAAVGISEKTLNNWKLRYPDFLQSIRSAKGEVDAAVEASLFARATGYSCIETKVFMYEGMIVTKDVIKRYPPDTTAAIFWLCNRDSERWRRNTSMPELPPTQPATGPPPVKKTFEQFCVDGGYPNPFPKQVEMREFGFVETDPRLLLGARGTGKTDYVTILGTAYEIYANWWDHTYWNGAGKRPDINETNLIISKSKSRNSAMIEEIGTALKNNGVPIAKQNTSRIRIEGLKGKDHSVEALTVKSSVRGRHPKRAILDDPVTDEDVSEAVRLGVKRKYNEIMKLCANVIVIGQPAHLFDLYAELRPMVKKMEVPYGSIPELDHDLEAQRAAGVDENSIQASYFLKVVSEGVTPFDKIKYIDQFPVGQSAVAFIDPSHEGGDYTALTILKQHFEGIAVLGFVYKKAWNHCLEEMMPHIARCKVQKLCFETNALGDQPVIMLRQLLKSTGVGVVGRKSTTHKHSRIMAAGAFAHLIHLSKESHPTYINHVVQYEYKSKYDDAPDSLATCLEWIGLIKGKQ